MNETLYSVTQRDEIFTFTKDFMEKINRLVENFKKKEKLPRYISYGYIIFWLSILVVVGRIYGNYSDQFGVTQLYLLLGMIILSILLLIFSERIITSYYSKIISSININGKK